MPVLLSRAASNLADGRLLLLRCSQGSSKWGKVQGLVSLNMEHWAQAARQAARGKPAGWGDIFPVDMYIKKNNKQGAGGSGGGRG
jgi:hypothetical protein